MSRVYLGIAVLIAIVLGGCKNESEKAASTMIDKVKDMTKVLKDIKDKDSAASAKSKLEALNKEISDFMTQTMNKKFNEEERKKAAEKYEAEAKQAMNDLDVEWKRVQKIPGAVQAMGPAALPMGGFGSGALRAF